MKTLLLIILWFPIVSYAQTDTTKLHKIREQLLTLSNKVDKIDKDQNNYLIEKDLLKETYSSNYATINLLVTAILGIFAVLTFFGTRDINSIKKEYREELDKLKVIQKDIENKSKEFDDSKQKYDTEITKILKQNEAQNIKIKVLEIKEKITSLYNLGQYLPALEFCIVGLDMAPEDQTLKLEKGKILGRLKRFDEAIDAYESVILLDENNSNAITNVSELYLFLNQRDKVDYLLHKYHKYFKNNNFDVLEFFELIKKYHDNDLAGIKEYARQMIVQKEASPAQAFSGWDFTDALNFISEEEESDRKDILMTTLLYMTNRVSKLEMNYKLKIGLDHN